MSVVGSPITVGASSKKFNSNAVADAYSDTRSYAVGDYATYKGYLYKNKIAIASGEVWNPQHWDRVTLDEEMELFDGMVIVSETQPTNGRNKIWFKPNGSEVEIPTVADLNAMLEAIAAREDSNTATRAYKTGDLIFLGTALYKATSNIAIGALIVPGTNVAGTTIEAQLGGQSNVADYIDSLKGIANGIAGLDGNGKIPVGLIPGGGSGSDIDVEQAVADYFDEHPVSDSIPDESLSIDKLENGTLGWVTPEMFYDENDEDDWLSIQKAINTGLNVKFKRGKTYLIHAPIVLDMNTETPNDTDLSHRVIRKGIIYDGNGCTIRHDGCNGMLCASETTEDERSGDSATRQAASKKNWEGQWKAKNGLIQCEIRNFDFVSANDWTRVQNQSGSWMPSGNIGLYVAHGANAENSNYMNNCAIRNCRFKNHAYGMWLGGYQLTVDQCIFYGCCMGINDDCVNCAVFSNNRFNSCLDGLNMNLPYFTTVINNTFYNMYRRGIAITGLASETLERIVCTVIGNYFRPGSSIPTDIPGYTDFATSFEFYLGIFYFRGISVIGNYLRYAATDGSTRLIRIQDCVHVSLSDNVCEGKMTLRSSNSDWTPGLKYIFINGGYYSKVDIIDLRLSTDEIRFQNTHIGEFTAASNIGRKVIAENVRVSSVDENVPACLKNASITTPTELICIKSYGDTAYRLVQDNDAGSEKSYLVWEQV